MMATKKKNPWEQLPGETDKAYSVFVLFRDMPTATRTVAAAYKAHTGRTVKAQALPGHIKKWSTQHRWLARARAWDAHLLAKRDAATVKTLEQQQKDHVETVGRIAATALQRVAEALEVGFVEDVTDDEGNLVGKKLNGTPSAIAALLEKADKVARLALNMPTDRPEHTGANGGPIQIEEINRTRDELRARFMAKMSKKGGN